MSEKTRIAALRAAIEMRIGADRDEAVLARAARYDDWLVSGSDPLPAEGNAGTPIPGSADTAKAPGEAAAEG